MTRADHIEHLRAIRADLQRISAELHTLGEATCSVGAAALEEQLRISITFEQRGLGIARGVLRARKRRRRIERQIAQADEVRKTA